MPLPRVGEVHDGYRYAGGDPNSKESWEWVGEDSDPSVSGYDAVGSSKKYRDVLAAERAKDDIARLTAAAQGQRDAAGLRSTAERGEQLLAGRTPVGAFADARIAAGRVMPNVLGKMLPFVPDKEETANLESFRTIGSEGALGDVSKLKGPLSEKELAFIQRMQADPGATPEYNRRVLAAQKWAANRQSNYGSAMREWTRVLGSPSALNANGLSFDAWWGDWASKNLPQPGLGAPAATKRPAGAGAAKPGQKSGYRILSVE